MPVYDTDFITSRMLTPHLRKQGGFEVRDFESDLVESQVIEIPLAYLATTTDMTLSALQTIDTIYTPENLFVLVKDQADKKENGLYFPSSGNWTRWNGLRGGMLVTVRHGDENNDTVWQCVNEEIEFGTTEIEFTPVGGGNDELVKVTANDTTPDYLNEKVSVLRGLVKSTLNPSGDEGLQIALPTGTNKYVMRFDGVNWVPTELIQLNTTNVTGQYLMTFDGTYFFLGRNSGTTSTRYWFVLDPVNGVALGTGGGMRFRAYISGSSNLVTINGDNFNVSALGAIQGDYYIGTGNRPVYADSNGNLINYTNNLVITQNSDLADDDGTYRLTDFVFTADTGRQHVVKYCLEFEEDIGQDVKIILTTADTGMTASGTVKMTNQGGNLDSVYFGTSYFCNLDYTNHIVLSLNPSLTTNYNYVEIELYILPTGNSNIQLAFSQDTPDNTNPITLKAGSKMFMRR